MRTVWDESEVAWFSDSMDTLSNSITTENF